MKTYIEQLKAQIAKQQPASHLQSVPSQRVIELAEKINKWHDKRPVPERWQPVILGRIAALFGVTREQAAAGMQYAGWQEKRTGTSSLWQAPTNFYHNMEK